MYLYINGTVQGELGGCICTLRVPYKESEGYLFVH